MIRALLLSLLLLATPSLAQMAPEGNAHPDAPIINEADEALNDPFAQRTSVGTLPTPSADKYAFAQRVDLDPLRGIAVFHAGRVKILDTLSRETVEAITGRHHYDERTLDDQGEMIKRTYDPMFTLFDLVIDPAYYADKPLLAVEYLPLRRLFLENVYPDDDKRRESALKLGRLSPIIVQQLGPQLEQEHAFEQPYREAFARLRSALDLAARSNENLFVIAPATPDAPYQHLGSLPSDHEAIRAAKRLATAWRALDADGANGAIADLASILPTINSAQYPTTRTGIELLYNKSNAFTWGYWLYLLSFVSLLLAFGTGRRWLIATGVATLFLALGLHAFGFGLRCFIAERFAIQNQFESMTGISLFAAFVGAVLMLWKRQWLFGAASAAVGFMILITATETAIPGQSIEREAAILNTSVLLKYHVTTVLTSYGLIALGFIVSLFYLAAYYGAKLRSKGDAAREAAYVPAADIASASLSPDASPKPGIQRTLKDLDTAQMTVLQLAFWTLGVGILLGAWWADHSWGRWWAFDPKETWALVTWIVYLIVIHLRLTTTKNRALITAWLSVVGFFIMLWTYFGVNLLLPGLHAYA